MNRDRFMKFLLRQIVWKKQHQKPSGASEAGSCRTGPKKT